MAIDEPRPFWTVEEYGEVTKQQYRDLKAKVEIDWAALNKSMRETVYKGLFRQAAEQSPYEIAWQRLMKQSQVQQEASKPLPALGPAPQTKGGFIGVDEVPDLSAARALDQREHIWNMLVLAAESSRHNT